jgi:hypothetical protein
MLNEGPITASVAFQDQFVQDSNRYIKSKVKSQKTLGMYSTVWFSTHKHLCPGIFDQ